MDTTGQTSVPGPGPWVLSGFALNCLLAMKDGRLQIGRQPSSVEPDGRNVGGKGLESDLCSLQGYKCSVNLVVDPIRAGWRIDISPFPFRALERFQLCKYQSGPKLFRPRLFKLLSAVQSWQAVLGYVQLMSRLTCLCRYVLMLFGQKQLIATSKRE